MKKNHKKEFERRKNGIINIFNFVFWAHIITVIANIIFKTLYLTKIIKYDGTEYTLTGFIISIIFIIFLYISTKSAKKEEMAAGLLGIILGTAELIGGGILWKIIGALLVVDSLAYLKIYNKK